MSELHDKVITASPPFREGTVVTKINWGIILNAGGIGDYINWVPAIRCAIDSNPHLHGYVVTPPHFADLAKLWLGSYSDRFRVHVYSDLDNDPLVAQLVCVLPTPAQLANATGFPLFDLGFIYYTQKKEIPAAYNCLPEIRGNEAEVRHLLGPFRDYAVITTGATCDTRRLPASLINEITDYLCAEGVLPVFLGKYDIAPDHKAKSPNGLDLTGVLDLRDKTTLVEAAVLMSHAKFVFGLDNGLLHLASCSKVPVISLFTTIEPRLRTSPRQHGARTHTLAPKAELKCRFCNSNIRYIPGFDFNTCLYNDYSCTKNFSAAEIIEIMRKELAWK